MLERIKCSVFYLWIKWFIKEPKRCVDCYKYFTQQYEIELRCPTCQSLEDTYWRIEGRYI